MEAGGLATLAEAAKLLATGGPTVGLLALLWAMMTGRMVTGREFKAATDERDRLRSQLDAIVAATTHALDDLAAKARADADTTRTR